MLVPHVVWLGISAWASNASAHPSRHPPAAQSPDAQGVAQVTL